MVTHEARSIRLAHLNCERVKVFDLWELVPGHGWAFVAYFAAPLAIPDIALTAWALQRIAEQGEVEA